MNFSPAIEKIDRSIFFTINTKWTNSFFDAVLPFMRAQYAWIWLYAIIIFYLIYKYRINGLFVVLVIVITITISDQLSSALIKPLVHRDRPCQNPEIKDRVRLLVTCGVGKSFTSSHATNYFALATIVTLLFGKKIKRYSILIYMWAAIIGYAQIYVGVHYPVDIVSGALLGTCVGFFSYYVCKKFILDKRKWIA